MRARILAADDHALIVEGFRSMLEPEFRLVGTVEDGHALIQAAKKLKPDVILMDISMPLLNGIEAARKLQGCLPGCKIIFVTMHADAEYVTAAFRAGAAGYVLKRAAASELMTAIREVLQGRHYVTPLVTKETLHSFMTGPSPALEVKHSLTSRQLEVLQLVAAGRTRKEIAGALNISIKTVEFHKTAIMRELKLSNSAELIRYALHHGLTGS